MNAATDERDLVSAARRGDERAFAQLVEGQRGRLHAHCYRMMGSVSDADDALQETLINAWRGIARFDERSALSSWLYRIATNACLNAIKARKRRALPLQTGFRSDDPGDAAGPPVLEQVWIEPYPDDAPSPVAASDPEARYGDRESLELAFVAALQLLAPNQRAALILFEVLGFSADEVAATLGTTRASVNSALQRARKLLDEQRPERSQQAVIRSLDDEALRALTARYVQAMEAADVDGLVGMLQADATWSMPPQPAWFQGRDAIAAFLTTGPFEYFRWRLEPMRLNGQPAFACWSWDEGRGAWAAHAFNVLELAETGVAGVTSFLDVSRRGAGGPDFVADRVFERYGLPGLRPA
jgi:RNA polymerase sigma-70 factor (ECF subfamily)